MKKIIRLTESDLHRIVKESVERILREDVLGNDWREKEDNNEVMNNYEAFEAQQDEKDNNWGVKGEEQFDPTHWDNSSDDIVNA
jgi:hypothetical protein